MCFEEILKFIRKKTKVSREEWNGGYILLSDRGARYLYLYDSDDSCIDSSYTLSGYDITANDWKVVE